MRTRVLLEQLNLTFFVAAACVSSSSPSPFFSASSHSIFAFDKTLFSFILIIAAAFERVPFVTHDPGGACSS